MVSRSNCANTMQMLSMARPMGEEVSNFSVVDTNSTLCFPNFSIILEKSRIERLMRSNL